MTALDIRGEQINGPGLTGWLLLGEDHTELDDIAVRRVDERCSIALSRGKYPKGYGHVDPNEDAVLAVTTGDSYLLAAVDGHNGFDAARAAVVALAESAPDLLCLPGSESIGTAFAIASSAVDRALKKVSRDRKSSGAALTVAHIVEGKRLYYGAMGDALAVTARRMLSTSHGKSPFLKYKAAVDPETGSKRLGRGHRIALVTDGVVDFMGREWKQRIGEIVKADQPLEQIADSLVEESGRGGGGDNAAVVVYRA